MEEPKLSDSELYAIFEKCGWYDGRKEDIAEDLPERYRELPPKVNAFLEEFMGLVFEHEFEIEYDFSGELERETIKTKIRIIPDFGYDGCLDDTAHRHYSKLIGKKLYPLSMLGHSYAALDADLNMYIFEMGFGCMRISDNPIDGIRNILINDLYTTTYEFIEYGENKGTWRKRPE